MRDLKRYWQEIRALETSLPEFVWLASIEDSMHGRVGGRVAEVSAAQAALLLHAKSHRVATEEEVAAYRVQEELQRRRMSDDALRRQGVAQVTISRGR